MSKFTMACTRALSTGRWLANHSLPSSPSSSPVKLTNSTERMAGVLAKRRASSSTVTVPEPLSSAPLRITCPFSGSRAPTESVPR